MPKNQSMSFLRAAYRKSKSNRVAETISSTNAEPILPADLKEESVKNVLDEAILHKAAILVEGETDKKVYQRFLNSRSYVVLPVYMAKPDGIYARQDVIEMVRRGGRVKEYTRILGIIDSDFAQIKGAWGPVQRDRQVQEVERVFITDTHDLETMIMNSECFLELLEIELKQRKKAFHGKKAEHIRGKLIEDALHFGYVSYLSRRLNQWNGITTKMKETEVGAFYQNDRLDLHKLAEFIAASNGNNPDVEEIKDRIKNCINSHETEDNWQVCNGHICARLLTYYLQEHIPSPDKEWERRIHESYSIESFNKTRLYEAVKGYVTRNNWKTVFQ